MVRTMDRSSGCAEEMQLASDRMEFERAATLRDKLHRLEELREQFGRLAIRRRNFVISLHGSRTRRRRSVVSHSARTCAGGGACRRERRRDRQSLDALVQSVYSPPERQTSSVPTHEIDELLLLSSWFRRNPAELDNTRSADSFAAGVSRITRN